MSHMSIFNIFYVKLNLLNAIELFYCLSVRFLCLFVLNSHKNLKKHSEEMINKAMTMKRIHNPFGETFFEDLFII